MSDPSVWTDKIHATRSGSPKKGSYSGQFTVPIKGTWRESRMVHTLDPKLSDVSVNVSDGTTCVFAVDISAT